MRANPVVPALLVSCLAWSTTPAGAQPPLRPADGPPAPFDVLQHDAAHCAHEDEVGFLWVCTDEGLGRYDGHELVTFGREAGEVRALVRDRDGRVWVGGGRGLYEFVISPQGRQPFFRPAARGAERTTVRALAPGHDRLVFVATDAGVQRLVNGTLEAVALGGASVQEPAQVDALLADESGALWAATPTGLYLRTAGGARHRFTTADGLPADEVRALALDEAGRLWVGTARGLALVYRGLVERREPGAVRAFTTAHGLPSDDVRALHQVARTLWIGTSDGVAAMRGFSESGLDLRHVSTGFTAGAISSGPSGDIWMATASGVRAQPQVSSRSTATVITAIRVDGRPEPMPAAGVDRMTLDLSWRVRLVEIEFASPRIAIRARAATRLSPRRGPTYQVRSLPVDDRPADAAARRDFPQWSSFVRYGSAQRGRVVPGGMYVPLSRGFTAPTGVSSAESQPPVVIRRLPADRPSEYYTGHAVVTGDSGWLTLPPGTARRAVIEHPSETLEAGRHRFVAHATSQIPTGRPATVEFTVRVAPWVQWWLLGPLALAVTGAGALWHRSRTRRQHQIAMVRSRIAADLHDSVGASLSRIALLSDVAVRQAGHGLTDVVPALAAIGENARAVIDEMNDAVWLIDADARDVRQLLVRIRTVAAGLFEPDGISWRVDAPEEALGVRLSSDERRHVYLILREALTNARRHARPRAVSVDVRPTDAGLRFEVADDGIGIAEAGSIPQGNGLANMDARAGELRATLRLERRDPGPGTRVILQTTIR